ncbi:MAG: hypoxanthine phosphoribosyltransferase [Acidobacteriota bacterium]
MRRLADEILIPAEAIASRVVELAREIERETPPDGEIAALIVLKGAFVFGADLLRAIRRPTRVGFLEIHRQSDDGGEVEFVFTHPFPIEGRDVLVIEDILDTGVTMNALLDRLRARRPARLRTAVLLDKRSRRQVECPVEHVGFEIPDRWVVGYGLDDDELYRNLPGIGWVVENP